MTGVRNAAMDELVEEARSTGANAIIGIRFASSQVASGTAEIFAYGTAVKKIFTSYLHCSVAEKTRKSIN